MSSSVTRKVDQCLQYAQQILDYALSQESAEGFYVAVTMQLERAMCFYLSERVGISGNRTFNQPWVLDEAAFNSAFNACSSSDLQEFQDVLSKEGSWLNEFINLLTEMRQLDKGSFLRGEIFQSDLESKQDLIATSAQKNSTKDKLLLKDITPNALQNFLALVKRQRLAGEEW